MRRRRRRKQRFKWCGVRSKNQLVPFACVAPRITANSGLQVSAPITCLGGAGVAGGKCGTATASQHRDKLKLDPMATGQRWYCPVCNKKYKTTFGLIVEITGLAGPTSGHYAHAEFPPQALLDSKLMMIERQLEPYKTPEALLNALPSVKALERTILQPTDYPTFGR